VTSIDLSFTANPFWADTIRRLSGPAEPLAPSGTTYGTH
jgi:hypothetical protein